MHSKSPSENAAFGIQIHVSLSVFLKPEAADPLGVFNIYGQLNFFDIFVLILTQKA